MRFIYIVDDDRISRHFIQEAVPHDSSTIVRSFASGKDFLDEAHDLDPGIVLLDLNMPEMDGTQVLEKLQSRNDGKFVTLLVTASRSVHQVVLAMKYGAVDVIEKPFDAAIIGAALAPAFARLAETYSAASVALDARRRIGRLSPREQAVLAHMFEGCPNKITAHDLGLSPRTVEIYRAALMRKLDVEDLAHAVRLTIAAGWDPRLVNGKPGQEMPVKLRATASAIFIPSTAADRIPPA